LFLLCGPTSFRARQEFSSPMIMTTTSILALCTTCPKMCRSLCRVDETGKVCIMIIFPSSKN
ncbi:MAG: hypothetical protein P8Y72_12120, partial [Anaerolineales bacterium]